MSTSQRNTTAGELSAAQAKTLRTVAANGGEMNGFAGQPGFSHPSLRPLRERGLLERIGTCACCDEPDAACSIVHRPVAGRGGAQCYDRHRITPAGYDWLAAHAEAREG